MAYAWDVKCLLCIIFTVSQRVRFSLQVSSLVAAGCSNGCVTVYDVTCAAEPVVIVSTALGGKHLLPVTQVGARGEASTACHKSGSSGGSIGCLSHRWELGGKHLLPVTQVGARGKASQFLSSHRREELCIKFISHAVSISRNSLRFLFQHQCSRSLIFYI